MTKSKSTKKALIASITSLAVCFTMLVGTTFAWFTDTASVSVNKIQAGTLDVALVDNDEISLEGKTLGWKAADDRDDILWEPGATYELNDVFVKNNGNLALKYKVVITGINGNAKLLEVIDFTITIGGVAVGTEYKLPAGEMSDAISISATMRADAGNEYMGLSIDGIGITVYATQDAVEEDKDGATYDAAAEYDTSVWDGTLTAVADTDYVVDGTTVTMKTANGFAYCMNNIVAGNTYVLAKNIDLAGYAWTPVNVDKSFTFDGANHSITNLYVSTSVNGGGFKNAGIFGYVGGSSSFEIKNVVVSNADIAVTYEANTNVGVLVGSIVSYTNNRTYTFTNCKVINSSTSGSDRAGGIYGYATVYATSPISISNCEVSDSVIASVGAAGSAMGHASAGGRAVVKITNSKFANNTISSVEGAAGNYKAGSVVGTVGVTDMVVTGCTVTGNTVTSAGVSIATQYGRLASGTYTN